MIISKREAKVIADKVIDKYHQCRGENGVTNRDLLSQFIYSKTGRRIKSEGSLNKIEAILCTL